MIQHHFPGQPARELAGRRILYVPIFMMQIFVMYMVSMQTFQE